LYRVFVFFFFFQAEEGIRDLIVTGVQTCALPILGITALVLAIAVHQGASAIGSTIAAVLFILGFVIYLRIVAPVPFTITLEPGAVVKRSKNGEVIEVRWEDLTRVKEEFFPNGKRISVIVYRKPTSPEQKAKA